jgi:hypothetical protein
MTYIHSRLSRKSKWYEKLVYVIMTLTAIAFVIISVKYGGGF